MAINLEDTVNGKPLEEIPVEIWQKSATRPLELLEVTGSLSVIAKTHVYIWAG